MALDTETKTKVEKFVEKNEKNKWFWVLAETVANLAWVEKETKEWFLSKWLKNDENLLTYAELAMKTEKLNFWEIFKQKILELKLSITCPYFADFKEFLKELKCWTDTSDTTIHTSTTGTTSTEIAPESTETWKRTFCWTSISEIKSEPFQRNSKTWVTWCSKTARCNWRNFWISLPSWNAYDAWKLPWKDSIQTIPSNKINKQPKNSWNWIEASAFKSIIRWNYADIYTTSKSWYGHRAAAFKDDNWQWYVLDPYSRVNWRLDNTPKKLEDYLNTRKIVKAHIYESKWYMKKRDDNDDKWTWYEWKNH